MCPTRLTDLRQRTHPSHEALEHSPALQPLLSEDLAWSHYESLLIKFFGFYEPLEKALVPLDAPIRYKTPWLRADLTDLGKADALWGPRWDCPLLSVEETLGGLYVTEGACLGGRLILSHLERSLGKHQPQFPRRFYTGYGPDTGRQWQRFKAWLADYPTTDEAGIIRGAEMVFVALKQWLEAE